MPTTRPTPAAPPPTRAAGERPRPLPAHAGLADLFRVRRVASWTLLGAALSTACVPGYDACFDPAAVIRSPQVLAIRADPPEAVYEPGDAAPVLRLRALVAVGVSGGTPAKVSVRLCPPNLSGRCDDGVDPAAALTIANTDDLDVPGLRVPPEVIARALAHDPLHGYGGVRVLADLSVEGTGDAAFALRAGKVLLFSPHGTKPNGAIELDSLEVGGKARATVVLKTGGTVIAYLPDGTVPIDLRPDVLELTPQLAAGSVEEYDTIDLAGRGVRLLDNVTYNFHASLHVYFGDPQKLEISGGFRSWSEVAGGDLASEPLPGAALPAHGLVRARTLAASPRARIWVVARDTRGAEAWTWIFVSIVDTRCCNPDAACNGTGRNGCPSLQEPLCDFAELLRARLN